MNGQSASLSWYQTTIKDPRPILLSLPWKLSTYIWGFQYGQPSLMRGGVCNLHVQVLLDLANTVTLWFKYRRTWDHSLLSHLRLGSMSVISYGSQGNILNLLHMRETNFVLGHILHMYLRGRQNSIGSSVVASVHYHGNVFTMLLHSNRSSEYLLTRGIPTY
jgi:hypothetical protein